MPKYSNPAKYIPHRPPMLFIEEVCTITDELVECVSTVNREGVFSIVLGQNGELSASYLIEMMAQTVGVWAGYYRMEENKGIDAHNRYAEVGLLLSMRDIQVNKPFISCGTKLRARMIKQIRDGGLASFEGGVYCNDELLVCGKLTVYQPRQNELEEIFQI